MLRHCSDSFPLEGGLGKAAWAPAGTEGRKEGRNTGACWHVWTQSRVSSGKCGVLRCVYSSVDQQQCPVGAVEPCSEPRLPRGSTDSR